MTDVNREKVERYLQSLEEALGRSNAQSVGILGEVRGDLESHVERFEAEGLPEDEAVERALEEMGNPFELAHHMLREVPPFGGMAVSVIRYLIASGVILWTLLMLWMFRSGTYGFNPILSIVVLLYLPAILLLWPRVVWRRNWLFGLIPAGVALVIVLATSVLGTSASSWNWTRR